MIFKKYIQILLYVLVLSNCYGQSLKVVYGRDLYYFHNDKSIRIKKFSEISYLKGYDIIDSVNIFIAYNPGVSAEASCYITVFNIVEMEETFVEEIGSTGESFFQYNPQNDLVVFNWYDGIYTFKLHENNNIVKNLDLVNRIKNNQCFIPFWVSNKKIGYSIWENEKYKIKYLDID